MKKTLLVLLAIALVGSFAFAEAVVGGDASISGSVTLTAGLDLDSGAYGFQNDSDIQIVLPILGGDAGASGDDGVYAEIMVDGLGWEYNLDENDAGIWDADEEDSVLTADISATIYFNDFYLGLGDPDFEINNVDVSDDYSVDAWADAFDNGGGFTLGFKNDMMDVAFMVASENDAYMDNTDDDIDAIDSSDSHQIWNNDNDDGDASDDYTRNIDGDMIYGVSATVMPAEGVTVPFSFFFDAKSGAATEDLMAFGMAPSIVMGDLTLDIPVDYVSYGKQSGYELEPAFGYAVMEGFTVSGSFLYGSYDKVLSADVTDVGNLLLPDGTTVSTEGDYSPDIKNAIAAVTFGLADAEAFVPGLAWNLDVTLDNMMDYMDLGVDSLPLTVEAAASFDMGGMKPYVSTEYDFGVAVMEVGAGVELGSDFTGIDNAVITIDYYNDALLDGEGYKAVATSPIGAIPADGKNDTEDGRLTVAVVVSF